MNDRCPTCRQDLALRRGIDAHNEQCAESGERSYAAAVQYWNPVRVTA